jgi:hypothetical protein
MQVLDMETRSKGYKRDLNEQHVASETFKKIHIIFLAHNGASVHSRTHSTHEQRKLCIFWFKFWMLRSQYIEK